jgi:two-component system cell cycle sensor histidine kinase/response regulator CckA
MPRPLRVLFVEDSSADVTLLDRELRRAGFDPDGKRVETEADFLAALNTLPDIILSDFFMPRFSGLRAAELLRDSDLNIPFILISGTVGEDVAVEAMRNGASDYLLKDRIARLGVAVEQALEQKRLRDERARADKEIRDQLRELQRWHEAMLGREDRVLELKLEVNELLAQQNQTPRYSVPPPQ